MRVSVRKFVDNKLKNKLQQRIQIYRMTLRAVVPNTDYFKPIILKFKTFIYNTNTKNALFSYV